MRALAVAVLATAAAVVLGGCTSIPADGGSERPDATRAGGAPVGPGAEPTRPAAAARAGARPSLLLAGHGVIWEVDVHAERARRLSVPGLSGGDPPYRMVRRGARVVVWSGGTFVVTGRAGRLEPLARRAWFFLPSTHPRRVWLTFVDRDSSATDIGFRAVREITATGRVTVPDARPPRGWPERAARSGLLLRTRTGTLVLWDPRSRTIVNRLEPATLGDLGPVTRDTLASCVGRCGVLRFTDVRTGEQRKVTAPRRHAFEAPYGAFSPDGRWLALPIRTRGRAGRQLAIVDPRSGAVRVVPGSRVPRGYTLVDWSRDGRHVFLTGGQWVRDRRIVAYRRGARRATTVDVKTGAFYGMAAR